VKQDSRALSFVDKSIFDSENNDVVAPRKTFRQIIEKANLNPEKVKKAADDIQYEFEYSLEYAAENNIYLENRGGDNEWEIYFPVELLKQHKIAEDINKHLGVTPEEGEEPIYSLTEFGINVMNELAARYESKYAGAEAEVRTDTVADHSVGSAAVMVIHIIPNK
jgi:hypothetical protein